MSHRYSERLEAMLWAAFAQVSIDRFHAAHLGVGRSGEGGWRVACRHQTQPSWAGTGQAAQVTPDQSGGAFGAGVEWRTYQVEVLERGFRMDGRDFASLSAVAKKITGAHWSGPRFFGLTGG